MDKVKDALREAATYSEELARDKRLRSDIRSAIDHGSEARDRIRKDLGAARVTSRLANDRKLRRNVRALVDDLESASGRMRRKRARRTRKALLIVAGTGTAAIVATPKAARWLGRRAPASNGAMPTDAPVVREHA